MGTGTDSTDATGGLKLDVGSPGTTGSVTDGNEGCTFVDLLFVIDNSPSMGPYQAALATAFPGFVDAMVSNLLDHGYCESCVDVVLKYAANNLWKD